MTTNPAQTPLERAQELEAARTAKRLAAITELAQATTTIIDIRTQADTRRAALETELRTQIDEATRTATKAWNTALNNGWTETDLRRIGLTNPTPKPRTKTTTPTT